MRLALACVALFSMIVPAAQSARADVPPPPADLPEGAVAQQIVISTANKDVSFLRIPRAVLQDAQAPGNNAMGGWTPGRTRNIVAAACLSLGVAGVFLVRGKRRWGVAGGAAVVAVVGLAGVQAWGDIPPPQQRPSAPLKMPFSGDVVVEIVEEGFEIELVVGTKAKPPYRRVLPPGERE